MKERKKKKSENSMKKYLYWKEKNKRNRSTEQNIFNKLMLILFDLFPSYYVIAKVRNIIDVKHQNQ